MKPDTEQARLQLHTTKAGYDWWEGVFTTNIDNLYVKILFERLVDGDNGAIWCEAKVHIEMDGIPKAVLPPSRTNLMNASRAGSGWKGLIQTLDDLASSIRWDEPIATAVEHSIEVFRTGELERALTTDVVDRGHPFLLEPFVASTGVSVFFGEGGTGKSLIALALAVAVAADEPLFGHRPREAGPVVYFDYEDDHEVHEERLAAILDGSKATLKYPIYHRSLIAKVSQSQASMRRAIGEREAKLAVLDSIGMGRGGNANTAEDTIRLFRGLRSLGVPVLAIDHVSKEDKRSGSLISPYGSVYTINSARLLWGAVVATDLSSENEKYLNLSNTKSNRTALHQPMGVRLQYRNKANEEHKTRWLESMSIDMYDKWWEIQTPDTWAAIKHHLYKHDGSFWTINEMAMTLELEPATVEKAVQRHMGQLVREKKGRAYGYTLAADEMAMIMSEGM